MQPDRLRRRAFIGGITASVLGLAGCNDNSNHTGSVTGTTPGEAGRESSDSPEPTPTGTPPGGTPSPSNPEVKRSWDGLVVPVAPGLDDSAVVDPAETSTPLSDALDVVDATGDEAGFGTILLPPVTVEEAEPVVPSQYVTFLGWGAHTSTVRFTDLDADGFRVEHLKDGKFVTLDGFTVDGGDRTERSGGSALHFVNDSGVSPKQFNIGSLAFRKWVDPVIHCELGSPFDCVWEHLDFGYDANDGREVVLEREQALLGTQIGFIGAGNATGDPVLYTDFAGAKINIGFINIGGSAGQAVRIKAAKNGHVHVGGINFESLGNTGKPIVSIQGEASTRFDYIQNTNTTVRSMVQLGFKNGNNIIGSLRNNGTVDVGKIEVTEAAASPSYYFGPSADVTALTDISTAVVSFEDALGSATEATSQSVAGGVDQYTNAGPSDLSEGELALDVDRGGTGSVALAYRDGDDVYYWNASGSKSIE